MAPASLRTLSSTGMYNICNYSSPCNPIAHGITQGLRRDRSGFTAEVVGVCVLGFKAPEVRVKANSCTRSLCEDRNRHNFTV